MRGTTLQSLARVNVSRHQRQCELKTETFVGLGHRDQSGEKQTSREINNEQSLATNTPPCICITSPFHLTSYDVDDVDELHNHTHNDHDLNIHRPTSILSRRRRRRHTGWLIPPHS